MPPRCENETRETVFLRIKTIRPVCASTDGPVAFWSLWALGSHEQFVDPFRLVAGGNIKGGIAYGSTNADGTEVKDNPTKIGNLYATIYAGLGINESHGDIRDNLGRPRPYAANPISGGGEEKAAPIKDLLS